MKEDFQLVIESMHRPGGPDVENVSICFIILMAPSATNAFTAIQILNLSQEQLKIREVVHIDIVNDKISSKDYKAELDPTLFRSKKTKRGPLGPTWQKSVFLISFGKIVQYKHQYD